MAFLTFITDKQTRREPWWQWVIRLFVLILCVIAIVMTTSLGKQLERQDCHTMPKMWYNIGVVCALPSPFPPSPCSTFLHLLLPSSIVDSLLISRVSLLRAASHSSSSP